MQKMPLYQAFARRSIRSWATRLAAVMVTAMPLMTAVTVTAGPAAAADTNTVGFYYELRNTHSNKCADVADRSLGWNAIVHQWTCHRQAHQLWAIEWISTTNNVVLHNANSQLCMAAGFPYY